MENEPRAAGRDGGRRAVAAVAAVAAAAAAGGGCRRRALSLPAGGRPGAGFLFHCTLIAGREATHAVSRLARSARPDGSSAPGHAAADSFHRDDRVRCYSPRGGSGTSAVVTPFTDWTLIL